MLDGSIIARGKRNLEFPERLVKIELLIPIRSVGFARAGRYELAIFADGTELAKQFFDVEIADEEEGQEIGT